MNSNGNAYTRRLWPDEHISTWKESCWPESLADLERHSLLRDFCIKELVWELIGS